MKYVAFYLPQFHTIPENDEWWGEGFTEWERVKNCIPLYKGHFQPRVPYKYYDLSDVNVMIEQAKLAKDFGVYGFCYYHYWFKGKILLEKPLEQMLHEKNVSLPFCLCWANEPWTRAWDGNSKKILMRQEYGNQTHWEEHLNYLIPYFKDERYIKIKGKPVFLIYRTESFSKFDEMVDFWNKLLVARGYEKIYFVEMLTGFQTEPKCKNSQAVVEFEPMLTIKGLKSKMNIIKSIIKRKFSFFYVNKYTVFNYNKVCSKIINRNKKYGAKETILGAFPNWDNTPRFGDKGAIFQNVSTKMFGELIKEQTKKSNSDFLFINAWNEWSEGAFIEPDHLQDYKLLEEILKVNEE